jgi:hypothetical protein
VQRLLQAGRNEAIRAQKEFEPHILHAELVVADGSLRSVEAAARQDEEAAAAHQNQVWHQLVA